MTELKLVRRGVVIVVCLAVLGGLAACDKAEQAVQKTDLGAVTELTKLIGTATKSLSGITDLESAQAALPDLQGVDTDLGKLMENVKDMSPEQKSKLTSAVTKAMPQLEGAVSKITSMPGVGDVVGPTLTSLQSKFKSLM